MRHQISSGRCLAVSPSIHKSEGCSFRTGKDLSNDILVLKIDWKMILKCLGRCRAASVFDQSRNQCDGKLWPEAVRPFLVRFPKAKHTRLEQETIFPTTSWVWKSTDNWRCNARPKLPAERGNRSTSPQRVRASWHASRMPFLMSGWQTPRHTCTLRQKYSTTFSATNNRRSASMAYGSQQSIVGHLHRWCSPQTEWSARSANDSWKRWLDEWWRRMETSVIQWWWTIFVRNWRCPSSDGISRVSVAPAAVHRTPGKSRVCL